MTHEAKDRNTEVCVDCGKPIDEPGRPRVMSSRGPMHYRCFKAGTVHGRQVTLERCPNCNAPLFDGPDQPCGQCGVGPQIGGAVA